MTDNTNTADTPNANGEHSQSPGAGRRGLNRLHSIDELKHMGAEAYATYVDQLLVNDEDVLNMVVDYAEDAWTRDPEYGGRDFNELGFARKISQQTELMVLNELRARGLLIENVPEEER